MQLTKDVCGVCVLRFVLFRYMKAAGFCGASGLGTRGGWDLSEEDLVYVRLRHRDLSLAGLSAGFWTVRM